MLARRPRRLDSIDPAIGEYQLIEMQRDRLKVSVPFAIDIDFGTLDDFR